MKDLIIVGAGPAGITAAVYAARKRLDFSVLSEDVGGQAAWSGDIENYTGYQFITGPELSDKFRQHLKSFNFDLKEGVRVVKTKKLNQAFAVLTEEGEMAARALVIASGKRPRPLNIPGEIEYRNRGVSYCATCDGPLFSGKAVAIIGGGNSALDAALQMIRIASRVYLINNLNSLTADPVLIEKVTASPLAEVINGATVVEIRGDKFVRQLKLVTVAQQRVLDVEGVFVEVGLIPNSEFIDLVDKNELGEILVNCACETSIPGIFAAGDVTNVQEKQIIIAAGEGAKASLSAFRYLATRRD